MTNNILSIRLPISIGASFKWSIIFKIFLILNFVLLISLLVFYVYQVNAEVSERYLIQEYEKQLNQLAKENQRLEITSIKATALVNVTEVLKETDFERTEQIKYIRVLDNQVVAR